MLVLATALTLAGISQAEPPAGYVTGVRLITLNMAHARATGTSQMLQSTDMARTHLINIADIITREQPDIIAFQEIDSNSF